MAKTKAGLEDAVVKAVVGEIDVGYLVRLEQGAVRIPSYSFEEQECASYFAREMEKLGLEVEVMEVEDPYGSGRRGVQPIGRLRGTEGEPSMMLNGHMDHVPVVGEWDREPFSGDHEGGFIYGRGAQDDKGGIVAAIGAVAAIKRANIRLRGDVIVCPVMGHKFGGIGTRALIQRGLRPAYCVNTENSGNGIARAAVGVVKFLIHAHAAPTHFHSPDAVRARYMNAFEQLAVLIQRLGPSLKRVPPGGWLSYEHAPDLPDYPQLQYDEVSANYIHQGARGGPSLRTLDGASLEVQVRTVPGQTPDTVRRDLEQLLAQLRTEFPNLNTVLELPPKSGPYAGWVTPPFVTPKDAPIVRSLERWHTYAAGKPPIVGAEPRLGAVGDGNLLAQEGTQVVEYGPGSVDQFTQWPTPNERISVDEIVVAAKSMALTTVELCR